MKPLQTGAKCIWLYSCFLHLHERLQIWKKLKNKIIRSWKKCKLLKRAKNDLVFHCCKKYSFEWNRFGVTHLLIKEDVWSFLLMDNQMWPMGFNEKCIIGIRSDIFRCNLISHNSRTDTIKQTLDLKLDAVILAIEMSSFIVRQLCIRQMQRNIWKRDRIGTKKIIISVCVSYYSSNRIRMNADYSNLEPYRNGRNTRE